MKQCAQCAARITGRLCFTWAPAGPAYLCGPCADASTHAIDMTCGFAYHGRTFWFSSAIAAEGFRPAIVQKYRQRKVGPVRIR